MRSFIGLASGTSAVAIRALESGVHWKAFTPFSNTATCCASPPSAGMTYSWRLSAGLFGRAPGRSERKAIIRPSGDQAASPLVLTARVRRRAWLPSASAIQRVTSKLLVSQLVAVTS